MTVLSKRQTFGIVSLSVAASCVVDAFVSNSRATSSTTITSFGSTSFQTATPRTPSHHYMSIGSFPEDHMSRDGNTNQHNTNVNSDDNNVNNPAFSAPPSVTNTNTNSPHNPYTTDQYDGYDGSFPLPETDTPMPTSPLTRQLRTEREEELQSKYASGDEVFELRKRVTELREELMEARQELSDMTSSRRAYDYPTNEPIAAKLRVKELEKKLIKLNGRDAEFVYSLLTERLEEARGGGGYSALEEEEIAKLAREVEEARLCIPHLNMHGLWVGKYGEHGYEMINVTYSGDTLLANKVTGDKNVPRGELSFTVDLSPPQTITTANPNSHNKQLEPIELNARASRQWGKKYLPRHPGKGQVASEGYRNAQWMEGQLILVGRFFSFAWVPIGHQVFFGRPSPELTLKMLRERDEEELKKDHVAVMRDVAERCWDETYWVERENVIVESEFERDGCFE